MLQRTRLSKKKQFFFKIEKKNRIEKRKTEIEIEKEKKEMSERKKKSSKKVTEETKKDESKEEEPKKSKKKDVEAKEEPKKKSSKKDVEEEPKKKASKKDVEEKEEPKKKASKKDDEELKKKASKKDVEEKEEPKKKASKKDDEEPKKKASKRDVEEKEEPKKKAAKKDDEELKKKASKKDVEEKEEPKKKASKKDDEELKKKASKKDVEEKEEPKKKASKKDVEEKEEPKKKASKKDDEELKKKASKKDVEEKEEPKKKASKKDDEEKDEEKGKTKKQGKRDDEASKDDDDDDAAVEEVKIVASKKVAFQKGKIFVNVPEAKELVGGNKLNPYWKAIFSPPREKTHRTVAVKGTGSPKWSDEGRLLLLEEGRHGSLEEVVVEVWSEGRMSFRTPLGCVRFPLGDLHDGVPRSGWFDVQPLDEKKASATGGSILLQIIYLPEDVDMTPQRYEFSEPAHALLRKKQMDSLRRLLESGKVDLEAHDHDGNTVLQVATQLQNGAAIELLLGAGAKVGGAHRESKRTALHMATLLESKSVIELLVGAGAPLDAKDGDDNAPAHLAAQEDHAVNLALLLELGANINAANGKGNTPLHEAMYAERLNSIDVLAREHKPDLFAANEAGESVADMLVNEKVSFSSISNVMRAADIVDHREVSLMRDYAHREVIRSGTEHTMRFNWKESPQYSVSLAEPITGDDNEFEIAVLMHYPHNHIVQNQMQNIGLIAVKSPVQSGRYEPSFQQSFAGRASTEPLRLKFTADDRHFSLIPYAKAHEAEGLFDIVVFSPRKLDVARLEPWKYIKSAQSEWKGKGAAGARHGKNKWRRNPHINLSLPKNKEHLPVLIVLEQPRSTVDLDPYSIRRYSLHIGFYVYDEALEQCVGQIDVFRNAQEVYALLHFDTTERSKFVIVPCTNEANKESAFAVTVFCDEKFSLKNK
jgi:C2 domain/Ankyrin repeats (3 copies)/Calpain large subunit, domain III